MDILDRVLADPKFQHSSDLTGAVLFLQSLVEHMTDEEREKYKSLRFLTRDLEWIWLGKKSKEKGEKVY